MDKTGITPLTVRAGGPILKGRWGPRVKVQHQRLVK